MQGRSVAGGDVLVLSRDGLTFENLPLPPDPKSGHCMCVLDEGRRIFVTGGTNPSTFILDLETKEWTRVRPIPAHFAGQACGTVRKKNSRVD